MAQFQQRLVAVESGLVELTEMKTRLEVEAKALREHMTVMCLATVADIVHGELQQGIRVTTSPEDQDKLRVIQQLMMISSEASRMAAYEALRGMHMECPLCTSKVTCIIGRALLLLRDLLVLTVTIGKGPQTHVTLKQLLEDAMWQGCQRKELTKEEMSQLTLAFNKVWMEGNHAHAHPMGRKQRGEHTAD